MTRPVPGRSVSAKKIKIEHVRSRIREYRPATGPWAAITKSLEVFNFLKIEWKPLLSHLFLGAKKKMAVEGRRCKNLSLKKLRSRVVITCQLFGYNCNPTRKIFLGKILLRSLQISHFPSAFKNSINSNY